MRLHELSDRDRGAIEAAVAAAERRCSAEIVFVTAQASGHYGIFALLWAGLAAVFVSGILALVVPAMTVARGFMVEATVFAIVAGALQWRPLLLRCVPANIRQNFAARLAQHQFAARVHGRTAARNGVLVFLSLAERHVAILADDAAAARIADKEWQAIVDGFIGDVRAGRLAAGAVVAVERVADLLAGPFPPLAEDRNELPDRIVELPDASGRAASPP